MKSKKRWRKSYSFLLIILILISGVTYLFIRFKHSGEIVSTPIITFQYYQLVIMAVAALFTLCAVVVALFREQIVGLFKYADLKIQPRETDFIYERMVPMDGQKQEPTGISENPPPVAEKYETHLIVSNEGNTHAEDCTIQLHALTFIGTGAVTSQAVDVSKSAPINWYSIGKTNDKTTIYQNFRAIANVLEVALPISTKAGGLESKLPQLSVGGILASENFRVGAWVATFVLCSKNCSIIEYKIQIKWDGTWRARKNEIKAVLTIEELKAK